jgi:hypothetical protein
LYAARELGLELSRSCNHPGCDGTDAAGRRYQIKHRNSSTLNVDVNNFDFDVLVLVNVDEECGLHGMWTLQVEQAKALFTYREKYRKHQATQVKLKAEATKIR